MRTSVILAATVFLIAAAHSFGQGKQNYLNFEPPENDALAIARVPDLPVSGQPQTFTNYLLVANTTDDSIEIHLTTTNTNTFLSRIPTGQSPIGVYVKPTPVELNSATYRAIPASSGIPWTLAYSVNWIGDSITLIGLRHISSGGVQTLDARALRTVGVGDEPTGLAFQPAIPGVAYTQPGDPFHEAMVVTHGTMANWDLRDPVTLDPFTNGSTIWAALEMLDANGGTAVREAWQVRYQPASATAAGNPPKMFFLNRRGGNYSVPSNQPTGLNNNSPYSQVNAPMPGNPGINGNPNYGLPAPMNNNVNTRPQYDFDIWGPIVGTTVLSGSPGAPVTPSGPRIGGLGSTNFAMTFAPNGDLFVVGTLARNNDAAMFPTGGPAIVPNGETLHRTMENSQSGFVQSMLWRVTNLNGTPQIEALDLNVGAAGATKIAQPTGVEVYVSGSVTRVFVTGFNSDSLATVTLVPSATGPSIVGSTIARTDLRHPTNPFPNYNGTQLTGQMMGPRSLALLNDTSNSALPQKLYVLNKIDRSIYVLDPNTSITAATALTPIIPMNLDPTPSYIVAGRPFMYSARLSGSGTSSCASCHIDGHSDGLVWNLSDPTANPVISGAFQTVTNIATPPAAPSLVPTLNKGPMQTQSLRGLATFEVGGGGPVTAGNPTNPAQRLFSTEPLHWRGDKAIFENFNAAFVNLMGMTAANGTYVLAGQTNTNTHRGIPAVDMDAFRDFVFSMHYPPNPEQTFTRDFSGRIGGNAFGAPTPLGPPTIGTASSGSQGAQLGLELFFENISIDRTCSACHELPAFTNNVPTEKFRNPLDPTQLGNGIETAALRGLFWKEKRLMRKTTAAATPTNPAPVPSLANVGTTFNGTSFLAASPQLPPEGAVTGEFGLTHTGNTADIGDTPALTLPGFGSESTRAFTHSFILSNTPNPTLTVSERDALALFQREIDTGSSPGIGATVLVDSKTTTDPVLSPFLSQAVGFMEQQVGAGNIGLVARVRQAGVERGFRYDVHANNYVEETTWTGTANGTALAPQSRAGLFAMVGGTQSPDNVVVFLGVPLGSDVRLANVTRFRVSEALASVGTVSGIQLRPMRPNTAYARVASFPRSSISEPTNAFSGVVGPQPNFTKDFLWATLAFGSPTGPLFGTSPAFNHAPSRRFRVSGSGILPGAKLRIYMPNPVDLSSVVVTDPANPTAPINPASTTLVFGAPQTLPSQQTRQFIEVPIYPRVDPSVTLPAGQTLWETAVELDPGMVNTFLTGGPFTAAALIYGGAPLYNLLLNYNAGFAGAFFYNNPFLTNVITLFNTAPPGTFTSIGIAAIQQFFFVDLPVILGSRHIGGPEHDNWYRVEVINTFRTAAPSATPTAPTVVSTMASTWQRLSL